MLLLFSSCNNLFENPSEKNHNTSERKYITVTGSLKLDGAFPAEFIQMYQRQAELESCHAELVSASLDAPRDTSRTAFPTIPVSGITYVIKAINTTNSNDYYSGTPSFDYSSYTVGIPASETAKTYKIHISVILSGFESEYVLLSGESSEFTISSTTPVVTNLDINLTANDSDGRGIINLSIDVSGSGINSAVATYKSGNVTTTMNATKSGDILTFKDGVHTDDELEDGLSTGSWAITFNFYTTTDRTGEIVYSFTETVNIFENLTTNTWVQNGNEPWFVTTTDAGGNKSTTCRITAAMVAGYALKDIYVDSTRTTTDPSASTYTSQSGTFINPVTSFDAALALLHDASLDYTIYIKGTLEGQTLGVLSITDELSSTAGDTKAYHAHSLTICGATGVSESGIPQDKINAIGFGIALSITTQVPVTIKNLKIMRGYSEDSGGGIYSTGDLTLDSGTLITQNTANYYGGGVANDGGKLTIKSGAVISSNEVIFAKKGSDNAGGGGVYNRNGTLIMSGGTIKSNTAEGCGGGIFNIIDDGEKLCVAYIYGDAVIGGDTAADGNKTLVAYSDGGGIYNKGGLIYFGCAGYLATGNQMEDVTYYDPDPAKIIPWTGKLSHNTTGGWGGGIINYPSSLALNTYGNKVTGIIHVQSGKISSNSATMGGGIAHHNGTLFYIHGGTIGGDSASEGNSATNKGGGIYTMGKFYLKGGTVSYNTADLGGGVCGDNGLLMYGGTIKNNTATTHGGGVFVDYRSLQIRGSAYIPAGSDGKNDVYLNKRDAEADPAVLYLVDPITPPEECTDGIVALITPNEYIDNKEIITIAGPETATTTIANEFTKFDVKQPNATSHYLINYLGKLQSKYGSKSAPSAVYDIVYNDGSAEAYSESLVLSKKQKDNAIAVIYVIETGLNDAGVTGERMLGVGLVQKRLTWCTTSAKAYNEHISGIAYFADNNGSTNLSQIATALGTNNDTGLGTSIKSAEEAADLYPAYYFGINYKDQSRSHNDDMYYSNVAGTAFETGWYLPAYWELEILVHRTPALTAQINTIMELIHGMPFTKNFVDGEQYGWWTSSMRNEEDYKTNAMYLVYNGDSVIGSYTGKERGFITCAVRQFN